MNSRKLLFFGFLSWLIPFVISFSFYKPGGELIISYDLFKSIMMVVASITGCYLLYLLLKKAKGSLISQSIITGLSWFLINILFDVLILIPIKKVTFTQYMMAIGLRYLIIPIKAITIGFSLNGRKSI
ncbi:MAG TPA: hypothetical protein VFN30_10330 [Chitinophagaceae bacterium]|nr:hypothetical protein [Chitinophagaceae bacterium]